MRNFLIAMIAALLVSSGATAQGPAQGLRLEMGRQAVVGVDEKGGLSMERQAAVPLSPTELELIGMMLRDHPDAFGPKSAPLYTAPGGATLPAPEPNRLRFRFVPFLGGSHAVLIIENGAPRSYMYKARIGRGERSIVTDVCQLVPGKRSVEHWPYQIDWIEISDLRVIPFDSSKPPLCA